MSSQLTDIILNGAEKRLHNSMISIDLEKGTDYFYYKLLSDKIKCIRLSDETMKWFYSYLTSRVFFVSLDNVILEAGTVNCGFPQRSTRAFVIFVMYKWYSTTSVKYHTYVYADDASIFYQHNNVTEIENDLSMRIKLNASFSSRKKLTRP